MFNFHITLAMAVRMLQSIVADFGTEYTYTDTCVYVTDEPNGTLTAKCIVGQAFSRWGILRTLVAGRDVNPSLGNSLAYAEGVCNLANFDNKVRGFLAENFGITMDDEAHVFLLTAQQEQDAREPWSVAVDKAANAVLSNRGESVGSPTERLLAS